MCRHLYSMLSLVTSRLVACIIAAASFQIAARAPVHAQTPPPWTIAVRGEPVTMGDIGHALMLQFGAAQLQPVIKTPDQMPAFAPGAWYAGLDQNRKPLVWITRPLEADADLPENQRTEIEREYRIAGVLAALDLGAGGPAWQRRYHALPDDPRTHNAFATEIVDAVKAASAWTVAASAAHRR